MTASGRFRRGRSAAVLGLLASAAALPHPGHAQADGPERTAFTGASVFDGTGAPLRHGTTVVVADSVVEAVFADGTRPLPPDARVIPLEGRYLIPGLIDAHLHLYPAPVQEHVQGLEALLDGGITTIRDPAGDTRIRAYFARAVLAGEVAGPDIFFGALLGGPGFSRFDGVVAASLGLVPGTAPWAQEVTDTSDLERVIANSRATGALGVKLYRYLSPELTARLAEAARRQGMRVWSHVRIRGHTGTGEPWSPPSAVAASGAEVMSHASDFACEVMRCASAAERAMAVSTVDPEDARVLAVLREMAARGIILDATLSVDDGRTDRAWLRFSGRVTGAAHRLGVPLAAGTDVPWLTMEDGAPWLYREMELLVEEAGLTPSEALVAATRTAARTMGLEDRRGVVRPGARADLVVLERDPTEDIRHVRSLRLVMKGGRIVRDVAEAAPEADGPSHLR